MIPGGFGAISGGAGGMELDLGAGPAESGTYGNTSGNAGGQVFNFAKPQSLQESVISTPVMLAGLAAAGLWLYTRRK